MILLHILSIFTAIVLSQENQLSITSFNTSSNSLYIERRITSFNTSSGFYYTESEFQNTTFSIKGTGFGSDPALIDISINNIPCKILEDGIKENSLICIITKNYKSYSYNVDQLRIRRNFQTTIESQILRQYSNRVDMPLINLKDLTTSAYKTINFDAERQYIISGQQIIFYIGDYPCYLNRTTYQKNFYSPNLMSIFACTMSPLIEAGKYKTKIKIGQNFVVSLGIPQKSSLNDGKYELAILPSIIQTSPRQISTAGSIITIKGTGFPSDMSQVNKVKVRFGEKQCRIYQLTSTQIKCGLKEQYSNSTSVIRNSQNLSQYKYITGSGFKYSIYAYSVVENVINRFQEVQLNNQSLLRILKSGVKLQLVGSRQQYQQNVKVQTLQGFFYAPTSGDYIFTIVSYDEYRVYFNRNPGVPFIDKKTNLFMQNVTQSPYMNAEKQKREQQKNISLEGGKYYYMKVYFLINQGQIKVQIPNNGQMEGTKRTQIQLLKTNFTYAPLTYKIKSIGVNSGFIQFSYTQTNIYSPTGYQTKIQTVPYNATAQELRYSWSSILNKYLSNIGSYYYYRNPYSGVKRFCLDKNGIRVPDQTPSNQVYGYEWIIEYFSHNQPFSQSTNSIQLSNINFEYIDARPINGSSPVLTYQKIQDPSPYVKGTFRIKSSGKYINSSESSIDFPYDVSYGTLQKRLRIFYNQSQIYVISQTGRPFDFPFFDKWDTEWRVYFPNPKFEYPILQFETDNLTGGKQGTKPQAFCLPIQNYTSNIQLDTVNFQFMRTVSSKPSFVVEVNGLLSFCNSPNCSLTYFDEIVKISALSIETQKILITLTKQILTNNSEMLLEINNQNACKQVKILTNNSLSCFYLKDQNGFPIFPAGKYFPSLHIKNIGYINYEATVNPLEFEFQLSNPVPSSGLASGQFLVTLNGKGLPKVSQDLQITICDIRAKIYSIYQTQIMIQAPRINFELTENQLNCSIKVLYPKYNQTEIFQGGYFVYKKQLTPPEILSLSKTNFASKIKQTLQIYGSGFDKMSQMNPNNANVTLISISSSQSKKLKILQINDTRIKVVFSQIKIGNYYIEVQTKNNGLAKFADYQIVKVNFDLTIGSISPSVGSYFGGQLIQILGKSFSPKITQNQVFIGAKKCQLVEVSQTRIKCITPSINVNQSSNILNITVKVLQTQISRCQGNCQFTYLTSQNSPTLQYMSKYSTNKSDESITITGKKLVKQNSITTINLIHKKFNHKFAFTPTTANQSQIIWLTTSIPGGQYYLFVSVQNVGYTNVANFTINTVHLAPSSNISIEGGILSIKGFGLSYSVNPNAFEIRVFQNKPQIMVDIKVVETNPSEVKIYLPPMKAVDRLQIKSYIDGIYNHSIGYIWYNINMTGKAKLVSNNVIQWKSSNTNSIILQRVNTIYNPQTIKLFSILQPDEQITVDWTFNSTHIKVNGSTLQPGCYKFKIFNSSSGYFQINQTLTILLPRINQTFIFTPTNLSCQGGYVLVQNKINSLPSNFGKYSSLFFNGFQTNVKVINQTFFKLFYPPYIISNKKILNQISNDNLTEQEKQKLQDLNFSKQQKIQTLNLSQYVKWSNSYNQTNTMIVFDSITRTAYNYPSSQQCYIGVYFGQQYQIQISEIKFYPNSLWKKPGYILSEAKFQGSLDNITWTDIQTLDKQIVRGWNTIIIKKELRSVYRYFRFIHDNKSNCSLGQIKLKGSKISINVFQNSSTPNDSVNQKSVVLNYFDGNTKFYWNQTIFTYSYEQTPIVKNVQPLRGSIKGGQTIELNGISFGSATPQVVIDGKTCETIFSNQTSIKCVTSPRLQTPKKNTFQVYLNGKAAVIKQTFKYIHRWSDVKTWDDKVSPIDGQMLYVTENMHLFIDQSTPKLSGIYAQNSIIQISDELDIQIHTGSLILRNATLLAGTSSKPYTHSLKFIFYGQKSDNQIPYYGNKGIGCMNCKISLHGVNKQAWTRINSVYKGQNQISNNYSQPLNWQINDQIALTSSSFNCLESQTHKIAYINKSSPVLNLKTQNKIIYNHTSVTEKTINGEVFVGTQIGCLTRNIKILGIQNSKDKGYGTHVAIFGTEDEGLQIKLSNVQFKNCGQFQKNRGCINFNRNQDLPKSYVKNCTLSAANLRFITVASTNYLTVSYNVGYRVKGYNIQLKDGTEQNNRIQGNLIISSMRQQEVYQNDSKIASFYITNPNNIIRDNVAGGGQYYGFLYDFRKQYLGIYVDQQICTFGYSLGQNSGNIIHSVHKIGVQINQLSARNNICEPVFQYKTYYRQEKINPTKPSILQNYLIYRVGQSALLCQKISNLHFNNFTFAQNKFYHMDFYEVQYTQNVTVSNSTFIGIMDLNNPPTNITTIAIGLPVPGALNFTNIAFKKFIKYQTLVVTCSHCNETQNISFINLNYTFQKVFYEDILQAQYLSMKGMEKQIIFDNDGTFSSLVFDNKVRKKATILKGHKYLITQTGCNLGINLTQWDGAAVCDSDVSFKTIIFVRRSTYSGDQDKYYVSTKSSINNTYSEEDQIIFIDNPEINRQYFKKRQIWFNYFRTGSTYRIKTKNQMSPLIMFSYNLGQPNNKSVMIKLALNVSDQFSQLQQNSTCINGNVYQDKLLSQTFLCVNQKQQRSVEIWNSNMFFYNDTNNTQPQPQPEPEPEPQPQNQTIQQIPDPRICIKQTFVRRWSNISQWPSKRLPSQGQDVTLYCNWTVQLDINPPPINILTIDGSLIVTQKRQLILLTAKSIWIRNGSFLVGNQSHPFSERMFIQLNGNSSEQKNNFSSFYTNYIGSKNIIVSGRFQMYGITDIDQATFLTQNAIQGSSLIKVNSSKGWKIGDQIVISTSSKSWSQSQTAMIKNIQGSQIQLYQSLSHFHYGSQIPSVNNSNGLLYTASKVIHMSRNIKIVTGPPYQFGFSIIVTSFRYWSQDRNGSVKFKGVQFRNGGQGISMNPTLFFYNSSSNQTKNHSIVSKCSFAKCNSECVLIKSSNDITFTNNVLHDAIRSHIRSSGMRISNISSNVMIKSRKDPRLSSQLSVCLQLRDINDVLSQLDNYTIVSNQCYGSEDIGFVLPYIPCHYNKSLINKNIAAGCFVGFYMVRNFFFNYCLISEGQYAFNCKYGVIGNPVLASNLTYSKMILLGNQQGIILRFRSQLRINTAYIKNSYISAVSNPFCEQCNLNSSNCQNMTAIRLLSVTQNINYQIPISLSLNQTDIKSPAPLDAKLFVQNCQFTYYKSNYSQVQMLKNCKNNFIFKPHDQAVDLVGSTHLYDSKMTQSDYTSLVYFRPFNTKYLGSMGGCGQYNCTSLQNYFIQDHTGEMLGAKGKKALPNNMNFSSNVIGCQYKREMNGYLCNQTQQVAVLQFQGIAPNYSHKVVWPIYLTLIAANPVVNLLNVEKQWQFSNNQPLNRRKMRTNSLFILNSTYNLTFSNSLPNDMYFQIQKKSPIQEQFGWIKLIIPLISETSIKIQANQINIAPDILLENQTDAQLLSRSCGSYKNVYSKKYVEFILTTDCRILMGFVSSVKATIRLDQTVSDFLTNNGTAKFIDKMCTILEVDPSRVKIVGIYTGSTVIDFYIEAEQTTTSSNSTTSAQNSTNSESELRQINSKLSQAKQSGQLETSLSQAGFGKVLSLTSTIIVLNETEQTVITNPDQGIIIGTDNSNESLKIKVILISVIVPCVVLIIVLLVVIYFKKCRKPAIILTEGNIQSKDHQVKPNPNNQQNSLYGINLKKNQHSIQQNQPNQPNYLYSNQIEGIIKQNINQPLQQYSAVKTLQICASPQKLKKSIILNPIQRTIQNQRPTQLDKTQHNQSSSSTLRHLIKQKKQNVYNTEKKKTDKADTSIYQIKEYQYYD